MTTNSRYSRADIRSFEQDGYLVVDNFVTAEHCHRLRAHANQLLEGFDPDGIRSTFSSPSDPAELDAYFLDSGDQVRFFFEPDAFDGDGQLTQSKFLSINKIGHSLHEDEAEFLALSNSPELADLARALGFRRPQLIQSMYIFKQPRIGGGVDLHQDTTFLYTEPQSVVGFWFALEDATVDNGCLQVSPGGHRTSLRNRFHRLPEGGTGFERLDSEPFASDGLVPLEVRQGTLVVLHGLLPHASGPNRSERSRQAYTVHLIEADAHYPKDNWLQRRRPAPMLDGFE